MPIRERRACRRWPVVGIGGPFPSQRPLVADGRIIAARRLARKRPHEFQEGRVRRRGLRSTANSVSFRKPHGYDFTHSSLHRRRPAKT